MGYAFENGPLPESEQIAFAILAAQMRDSYLTPAESSARERVRREHESLWCEDCGVELFVDDIMAAVVMTGAFAGRCPKCVEQRHAEGDTTFWSTS